MAALRFESFESSFEATRESDPVHVSLLDEEGNRVPVSGGTLALAIAAAPIDIALLEAPVASLKDGVASFTKVRFDRPASRVQLAAHGGELSTTSASFDVLPTRPTISQVAMAGSQTTGCVEIGYTLAQAQNRPVDVLVEVDPDGDGPLPFRRATQAGSAPGKTGTQGVMAAAAGAARTFSWNATADIGEQDANLVVRMTGSSAGKAGPSVEKSIQLSNGLHVKPYLGSARVLAVADLDRDGWPDLVEGSGASLAVEFGPFAESPISGQLRSSATGFVSLAEDPDSAAVGDFDHDGQLDIVVADVFGGVSVLRRTGPRAYGPMAVGLLVPALRGLVAADVNGDGRDDFAGVTRDDGAVWLMQQSATRASSFDSREIYEPDPAAPTGQIVFGDVDHDGALDLVVGRQSGPVVVTSQGLGRFLTPIPLTGLEGEAVQVTDLDQDGRAEIVALGPSGLALEEFLPRQPIAATTKLAVPGFTGTRFTIGDVDGDGRPDVVTASASGVDIHLHSADRQATTFAAAIRAGSRAASFLAVLDLDRDGRADVMTSDATYTHYQNRTLRRCEAGLGTPRGSVAADTSPPRDLNGDGKPDLVQVDVRLHEAHVWYGMGNGTFAPGVVLENDAGTPIEVDDLAVDDVDGDGLQDRVELIAGAPAATLRRQDPAHPGKLLSSQLELGVEGRAIALADIDLDGVPDLLAMGSNRVVVLPGDPRHPGSFLPRMTLPGVIEADESSCGQFLPCRLLVADLDADGLPEIIAQTSSRLRVYPGERGKPGTFGAAGVTDVEGLQLIGAEDVVGDARAELLVFDLVIDGQLDALSMKPDGTMQSTWKVPLPSDHFSAAIADFDGDGAAEIALGAAHQNVRLIEPRQLVSGSALPDGRRLFATGTVASGDFDADGKPDLLACAQACLAFPNDAVVSAMAEADFLSQIGSLWIQAIGDLTGDGLVDLVLGSHLQRQLPSPTARFESFADAPLDVRSIADFDNDGIEDLVTGTSLMKIYLEQGMADFGPRTCATTATIGPQSVVDVDRDGQLDIVRWGTGDVRLIRDVIGDCQTGDPILTYDEGAEIYLTEVRDMNSDGWPDIVTSLFDISDREVLFVSLQRPQVPGTFLPPQRYPDVTAAALGDVDRDGLVDIVAVSGDGISLYRGDASSPGNLLAPTTVLTRNSSDQSVQLADIDRDGWLDLVLFRNGGGTDVFLHDAELPTLFHESYATVCTDSGDHSSNGMILDLDADGRLDFLFSDAQRGTTLVRGR